MILGRKLKQNILKFSKKIKMKLQRNCFRIFSKCFWKQNWKQIIFGIFRLSWEYNYKGNIFELFGIIWNSNSKKYFLAFEIMWKLLKENVLENLKLFWKSN